MTLREFINKLNEVSEDRKDIPLKYCGEWEAEINKVELSYYEKSEHYDAQLLMMIY